ncbi:ubiquitin carboxyl-terminal hydrolase 47 isoform X2 [Uranotaenia lowii]|nr:ubiquitin carboxyl-terminal hydrolase 47 isoform X2 [Uranotaenia lowii]
MSSDDDIPDSASPVESSNCNVPAPPPLPAPLYDSPPMAESDSPTTSRFRRCPSGSSKYTSSSNYRGLVNQAMTCYLNSLLQALFMTPEFRNAMYNWEFDGKDENKSIPYQLQKLFVNLQTAPKSAVETTDLTRSFGWDSADGWQQHDIQELCRVMFDALEKKFKNTKQADLINRLYEGKMIDYVKCLECRTEKKREDKFLDIPLPVRPFGSTEAYECIEDALRAFVQPETLEGNNQYHCETCDKKCDAHKGLKFSKFPYILTLHLKRFDFDYQTFHRIKLNDKVTFPETLNLNNFVNTTGEKWPTTVMTNGHGAEMVNGNGIGEPAVAMETAENFMKMSDDCSTTDSGSALEEEGSYQNGGTSVSSSTTTPNDQFMTQDIDEGIDMELNGDCKSNHSRGNFEAPGPYIYELFAIMIHSGSASGGHYYAYIKDFNSCQWFSFNDQIVTAITHDDIQKSFGGGSSKAFYSGAYSFSTNAYMLMYRQIDPSKNISPISEEEFPDHIKKLMIKIRESEAYRNKTNPDTLKINVYFDNPKTREIKSYKMYMLNDNTLTDALEEAYKRWDVEPFAPIERCRLVAYDHHREVIEKSFEGQENKPIEELMKQLNQSSELLLETREEHEVFEPYAQSKTGVMIKVYKLDPISRDVDGPYSIRTSKDQTVLKLKTIIARKLRLNPKTVILCHRKCKGDTQLLLNDSNTLLDEDFIQYCKVFASVNSSDDANFTNKLTQFAFQLDWLLGIYINLPDMDAETLKNLSIPRFVSKPLTNGNGTVNGNCHESQLANNDSNSEDSSLSDNDRTLVEDDFHTQLNGKSVNPLLDDTLDQEPEGVFTAKLVNGGDLDKDTDDDEEESFVAECKNNDYYFKAAPVEYHNPNADSGAEDDSSSSSVSNSKVLKVLVDKRASHGYLKYKLQSCLHVPMEYFKLFKNSDNNVQEITALKEELNSYSDGSRLTIELGRVLRKGEYKINLYYLNVDNLADDVDKLPYLCEWIVRKGQTIKNIKRDLLVHLADKYPTMTMERCRMRMKCVRSISSVLQDDNKIGDDVTLTNHSVLVLQEVDDMENATPVHINDVVLLVRRWIPSEMKLDKFQEIVFRNKCELRNVLSELSGIPEENLEYVKLAPRNAVTTLQIHTVLQWTADPYVNDHYSGFQDGNIVYYRDSTEPLKELTAEERTELNKRNARDNYAVSSPRKERSLKIYIDASPKKADD